jgi:hypothetical protein
LQAAADEQEWTVDALLGHAESDKKYLVRWKGFPEATIYNFTQISIVAV